MLSRPWVAGLPAGASRSFWLALLVAGALLIADVALLDQIPWGATLDEGTYAAAALQFARTGRAGLLIGQGVFGHERDLVHYGRISAAITGFSQRCFGVTLFAARLPALLGVLVTVFLVFHMARRSGLEPLLGLAAGWLWFVSVPARLFAHSARPDTWLLLFVLAAMLLLLRALDSRQPQHFLLAGLVAGASMEAHMVGSSLILTTAAGAFLLSAPSTRLRNAALLGLGAAGPVILWAWIHVFSQPDLWRQQWDGLWRHWAPVPVSGGLSGVLDSTTRRYAAWFWEARLHRYAVELPFLLVSLVLGWRAGPGLRRLVVLFLLFHLALALFSAMAHAEYMFAVYPLACILMVATLWGVSSRVRRFALLGLAGFYLLQASYWISHPEIPYPAQLRADVLREVGDHPFLASDGLVFHFDGAPMRTVVAATYIQFMAPDRPWGENFERYLLDQHVEFLLVDRVFEAYLGPSHMTFFNGRTVLVREYLYGPGQRLRLYRLLPPASGLGSLQRDFQGSMTRARWGPNTGFPSTLLPVCGEASPAVGKSLNDSFF